MGLSVSRIANALLPFRAGELSHVWLVYRCASVSIGANLASLVVVRLGRGVLPLTAHTVYTWIAIYLTFYLLARATALEVTFAEIVFVGSLPVIASALPLPTIAGVGPYEVAWAGGLRFSGSWQQKRSRRGYSYMPRT